MADRRPNGEAAGTVRIGFMGTHARPIEHGSGATHACLLGWADRIASAGEDPVLIHLGVSPAKPPDHEDHTITTRAEIAAVTETLDVVIIPDRATLAVKSMCPAAVLLTGRPTPPLYCHDGSVIDDDPDDVHMADAVLALTTANGLAARTRHGISVRSVVPAVRTPFLTSPLPKQRSDAVLFASRLEPTSGIAAFLEAVNTIGVDAVIVDRPDSAHPEIAVHVRGVAAQRSNITLVDPIAAPEDFARFLGGFANIVITPHSDDPVGMLALEAQAMGVRVIAGPGDSLNEFLGPNTHSLATPGADDLGAQIASAVSAGHDPVAAKHRRAFVARRFDPDRASLGVLDEMRRITRAA